MRSFPAMRLLALAVALAVAFVALLAPSASAATDRDPRKDVAWRVEGAPQPTAAEKARADVTRFSYELKKEKAVFTFEYRDWEPCPETGICDNQANRIELRNNAGTKVVTVWANAYGRNPNFSNYLHWENRGKEKDGFSCDGGEVARRTSASKDTITVTVPRVCFKKGWRFTKMSAIANVAWSSGGAWRDGWDYTDNYKVDWAPHR